MKTELIIIAKDKKQAVAKANSFGISMNVIGSGTIWGDEMTFLAHTPVDHRDERICRWFHERWDTKSARLDNILPILEAA